MKSTSLKISLFAIGCALLLGGGVSAQDLYSNAVIALNPVAYWPLQETTLPPTSPSTTLTNYGTLGSSEDGILNGNVVSGAAPVAGCRANAFDGIATANGAFCRAPYGGSAASPPLPFTIEAWVNTSYPIANGPSGASQNVILADYSAVDANHRTGWVLFNDYYKNASLGNTKGDFALKSYSNGGASANPHFFAIKGQNTVQAGVWYHLVIVLTSSNAVSYVNGVAAGSQGTVTSTYLPNNGEGGALGLTIATRGASAADNSLNWAGAVAQVAIYTNILTLSDAQADYNARNDKAAYEALVAARNPIIWYKMDSLTSQPVAKNYGAFGTAADGYYPTDPTDANTLLPGMPGPAFSGFGPDTLAFQSGTGQIPTTGPGVPVGGGNPAMWNFTGSFTISTWAQSAYGGPTQEPLSKGDRSFRFRLDASSYPHFQYFTNDVIGSSKIEDTGWHFWTGTYDSTSSTMTFYIDGVQSGAPRTITATGAGLTASELLLGGSPYYINRNWIGNVAHVAIFTNALSSGQVANLYSVAKGCQAPEVVTPVFPSTFAECWTNSTYVFRPVFHIYCAPPTYVWTLDSGSGPVTIPGATNATLAFQSIPGMTVGGGPYTLTVTATTPEGSISSFVMLTLVNPPAVARTIYSDSFARSGDLHGSQPDLTDLYSAYWGADGSFVCDGSAAATASPYPFTAWLPFVPEVGHVYVLSCDLNPRNGDNNWLGLGFATGQSTSLASSGLATYVEARGNRASASSGMVVVPGTGSPSAGRVPFDVSGPSTYQIVLDTTTGDASSGWTMSVWEDGIQQYAPETFVSGNPSILSVVLANSSTGNGAFDNLKLTDSGVSTGAPVIVQNPPAQLLAMQCFTATMPAAAAGATSYQWQFNGSDLADNGRITGSHTNRLSILSVQLGDAGSYQLIAGNASGSVTSSPCVLAIGTPPVSLSGANESLWTTNTPLNSSAYTLPILASNVLTLTDGTIGEACTAFFNVPQDIRAFYAQFVYQVVNPVASVGDGATFCLQNDPRGPAAVGGVTYSFGLRNPYVAPSAELVLNLYAPQALVGYSWNTHGSVTWPTQKAPGSVNIANGDPITMTLYYNGSTLALSMVDSGPVATNSYSTILDVGDLTSVLNSKTAYVGFSGSDSYAASTQVISDFTFVSLPTLPTLAIAENGSGAAVITWPGTFAGFALQQKPELGAATWENVTNEVTITSDGNCQVVIPAGGATFYRLAAGVQ